MSRTRPLTSRQTALRRIVLGATRAGMCSSRETTLEHDFLTFSRFVASTTNTIQRGTIIAPPTLLILDYPLPSNSCASQQHCNMRELLSPSKFERHNLIWHEKFTVIVGPWLIRRHAAMRPLSLVRGILVSCSPGEKTKT